MHSRFSNSSKQLCAFQQKFRVFLTWIILGTVINRLGNGREFIADFSVCRFHAFQDDLRDNQSQERKSYSWSESKIKRIACRFLVSFFCKLVTSQSLGRNLLDSSPLLWNISWRQLSVEQKFTEKLLQFTEIHENHKSFLTSKLLLFTVWSVSSTTLSIGINENNGTWLHLCWFLFLLPSFDFSDISSIVLAPFSCSVIDHSFFISDLLPFGHLQQMQVWSALAA